MDYTRYLRSKITVDDRALNMGVLQSFEDYVKRVMNTTSSDCLRIVEVGAGVGAMFSRLYKRKSLFQSCKFVEYTMIDIKEEVLNAAIQHLMEKFESEIDSHARSPDIKSTSSHAIRHANVEDRYSIHTSGVGEETDVTLASIEFLDGVKVNIVLGDALNFFKNTETRFDIIIAAAVLDLWQVEDALPLFKNCLSPSSAARACYFPINFDGVTDFFPTSTHGMAFDNEVVNIFHKAMGYRNTLGQLTLSCHTGRHLIPALQQHGASLKSVGGSAWTVYPEENGSYNADEKYFLSCIITFIEATVKDSEDSHVHGEPEALQPYLESRRKQLQEGKLYYLAHNIDIFCTL